MSPFKCENEGASLGRDGPGREGHGRKEGGCLKKKRKRKRNPRECRCCWTEGREVRFRFQPDRGSGGRTALSPIYEDPYRGRWT